MILSKTNRSIIRAIQREHAKNKSLVVNAKFIGRVAGLDCTASSNTLTVLQDAGYLRNTGLRDTTSKGRPRLFEPTSTLLKEVVADEQDLEAERQQQLALHTSAPVVSMVSASTRSALADEVSMLVKKLRVLKRGQDAKNDLEFLRNHLKGEVELYEALDQIDRDHAAAKGATAH